MTSQLQPVTCGTPIPNAGPARGVSPHGGSQSLLEVLVASTVGHFTVLQAWNQRARQRHHLSQLDDRLLADIGVTHAAAAREAAKRPWEV